MMFIILIQKFGKKVKYILTPKGISVLSKKTFDYISKSYTAILQIKAHMNDFIDRHYERDEEILIYGAQDEIYLVLIELLKTSGKTYRQIEHFENGSKFIHWDDPMLGKGLFLLGEIIK